MGQIPPKGERLKFYFLSDICIQQCSRKCRKACKAYGETPDIRDPNKYTGLDKLK